MSGKMSALVAKQILVLGDVLFNALWSPSAARSRGGVDGCGAWGAGVQMLALSLECCGLSRSLSFLLNTAEEEKLGCLCSSRCRF